jgi:hypothetical protein
MIAVPNVMGSGLADGFRTLRANRLCVQFSRVLFGPNVSNWIVSQAPVAGARVRPSSVVSLEVDSLEGTPIPTRGRRIVPHVVGLTFGQAIRRLEPETKWEALGVLPASRAQALGDAFRVTRQWRVSSVQRNQEYSSPFVVGAPVRLALTPRRALSCS